MKKFEFNKIFFDSAFSVFSYAGNKPFPDLQSLTRAGDFYRYLFVESKKFVYLQQMVRHLLDWGVPGWKRVAEFSQLFFYFFGMIFIPKYSSIIAYY